MSLTVLCSIGLQDAFSVVRPVLEHHTGTRIDVTFGIATAFRRSVEDGLDFDVAILTRAVIEALVTKRAVVASSVFDIARSGLGLAVQEGARKPDISSVDALRHTLLEAGSIASSSNGLAGIYFMEVLSELGIADRVVPKLKLETSGGYAAELAARGETELAVQLVSEILPVRGVELAASFPQEVQRYAILSSGVSASSTRPAASAALIDYLCSPHCDALFGRSGLERCGGPSLEAGNQIK